MPKCYICKREFNDKFTIFKKEDGNYICKDCIETKYELRDLFKGLIKQHSKAEGLTEEATDLLTVSYM